MAFSIYGFIPVYKLFKILYYNKYLDEHPVTMDPVKYKDDVLIEGGNKSKNYNYI